MSLLLAAESGPPPFLTPVAALLVTAAAIGYVCVRMRIVPIVGFLLAGVLVGPNALGLIREREVLEAAAEVGVILLLFSIGIEFSLGRLNRIRRLVLLGGAVQVFGAIGVTTGLLVAFGVPLRPALFTGFLVALSSTAIVLKLLGDRGQTGSPTGQAGLALLVFQDLAVVVMVLMLPIIGSDGGGGLQLGRALGTALLVITVTLVAARRLVPPLLEAVARACSPEVFLLSVIALCLGTAYLTAQAGVSVSLGAFLAGLVVSESRHSAHALGEILPLQILFSAVFFLSVGTLLDVRFLVQEPLLVLGAVVLVLGVKLLTTFAATLAVGLPLATGISLTLLLAQVGEFAFVLESAGREQGLTPADLGEDGSQAFIAATVLLLVATPALAALGRALGGRLDRTRSRRAMSRAEDAPAPAPGDGHVLISGWGETARHLAGELRASGVPVVVVTLSPDGAGEAEDEGHQVVRGDSTRRHVLEQAGVHEARMVVIGDDEPEQAALIAGVVSTLSPGTPLLVRAAGAEHVGDLSAAGADRVVLSDRASNAAVTDAVRTALGDDNAPPRTAPPRGATVPDTSSVVDWRPDPETACAHVDLVRPVVPRTPGCEQCLRDGTRWVHLRLCVTCGHVGCCESSPGRHAQEHAREHDGHELICSLEPGEDWGWCYLDETMMPTEATRPPMPTAR